MRLSINNKALCNLLNMIAKKNKTRDYWELDSKNRLWLNLITIDGDRSYQLADSELVYFWLRGMSL